MHLQPGRLPIGDILPIGWKLSQFSRRSEQRRRGYLTNYKHIEQTVVDACSRSDLDAAARLASIPHDCHRTAANNFAARQDQLQEYLARLNRRNLRRPERNYRINSAGAPSRSGRGHESSGKEQRDDCAQYSGWIRVDQHN